MLKIEDVKAGDELVCIDRDELRCNASIRLQWRFYMSEKDKITVSAVGADVIYIEDSEFHITKSVLQYFKKKEQLQQYTFDDLIDVAVQAKKDGVLKYLRITDDAVIINTTDRKSLRTLYDAPLKASQYEGYINYIKSLYKETFVIESEEDLNRVLYELDPKITLKTGEVIPFIFKCVSKNNLIFEDQSGRNCIPFVFLKGATVEQDRGRND